MLFISRFIKKDQPYVIQIKSDTRRLTGYNLLPPFPFFPRFMNSSDNKPARGSVIADLCRDVSVFRLFSWLHLCYTGIVKK